MSLPAFVTVNGFQFRGTTAFARGWVDGDGVAVSIPASEPFPPQLADSILDLLLASVWPGPDPTALEAALAKLGREKLAYIAPLAAAASPFASLTVAADQFNLLNAKVTALLAALVTKGYMDAS